MNISPPVLYEEIKVPEIRPGISLCRSPTALEQVYLSLVVHHALLPRAILHTFREYLYLEQIILHLLRLLQHPVGRRRSKMYVSPVHGTRSVVSGLYVYTTTEMMIRCLFVCLSLILYSWFNVSRHHRFRGTPWNYGLRHVHLMI